MATYKVVDSDSLDEGLSLVADAIRERGGTSENLAFPEDFVDAVEAIPYGGGAEKIEPVSQGVNFIDYDGTIVAAWTLDDLWNAEELPPNPDHSSDISWGGHTIALTSCGWNWTLDQILDWEDGYVQQTGSEPPFALTVGQIYEPTDGKIHILTELPEGRLDPFMRMTYTGGTVKVDWDDGSAQETVTSSTTADGAQHSYAQPGRYDITLTTTPSQGVMIVTLSGNASGSYLLKKQNKTNAECQVYNSCIHGLILNRYASLSDSTFVQCRAMRSVVIPNGMASVGPSAFRYCGSLRTLTLPPSVTEIGNYAFADSAVERISLPAGLTKIGNYDFYNASSLRELWIPDGVDTVGKDALDSSLSLGNVHLPRALETVDSKLLNGDSALSSLRIPESVTTMNSSAFSGCAGLGQLLFESAAPPTASSSSVFSSLPTDCVILVPSGSLSAYTSATNYPSSGTYTYREY